MRTSSARAPAVGPNAGILAWRDLPVTSIGSSRSLAQILILDEATSALDAESEALFRTSLNELKAGRTTIVVAHRLSTVHQADKIVVMDRGTVVEEGSHAELLRTEGGAYRRLYEFQLIR